jgi:hypothetical protein
MPLHEAIKYVLGAYLVFAVMLVAYGVIMATRTARVRHALEAAAHALENRER